MANVGALVKKTLAVAIASTLASLSMAASPAGAAVVALDDGIEVTVDDIVVDNLFLPFDTLSRSVSYELPDGMEAISAAIDGIPCLIVVEQSISCSFPANFGGQLSVQMRATSAFLQEDVRRTLVIRGGPQIEWFTVSAGAPLEVVAAFASADCAVLDALASGLGLSVEQVLVRSSALLQTVAPSFPLPLPAPGPDDCELTVVLPAEQAVIVLGYASLTRQSSGAWVELSGQWIAEILRTLVRGGRGA